MLYGTVRMVRYDSLTDLKQSRSYLFRSVRNARDRSSADEFVPWPMSTRPIDVFFQTRTPKSKHCLPPSQSRRKKQREAASPRYWERWYGANTAWCWKGRDLIWSYLIGFGPRSNQMQRAPRIDRLVNLRHVLNCVSILCCIESRCTNMVIKTDSSHEAEGKEKDRQVSPAKVKTRLSVKWGYDDHWAVAWKLRHHQQTCNFSDSPFYLLFSLQPTAWHFAANWNIALRKGQGKRHNHSVAGSAAQSAGYIDSVELQPGQALEASESDCMYYTVPT